MEGNKKAGNSQKKSNKKNKIFPPKKTETTQTKEDTAQDKNDNDVICKNEERANYWNRYKEPLVVATLLLFIATGFLYYEASQSGKEAKAAADIAKATLDEYKKDFEEINRPYLFITNFKNLDTIKNKPNLVCSFDIVNTGKFPAKLKYFSLKEIIGIDTVHPFTNGQKSIIVQNEFLPYNGAYIVNDVVIIPDPYKRYVFIGKANLFLVIDYEYFNEMLKKKYVVHAFYGIYYERNKMKTAKKIYDSEIEENL